MPMNVKRSPILIRPALTFAWVRVKNRLGLFSAVLLLMSATWVALEILVIAGQRFGLIWWAVAHLAFFLIFAGFELGFLDICLACYDHREITLARTFRYLALGPTFLAAQLLYLVSVVVGLALLALPGLYVAARYALVGFCLVDGDPHLLCAFQRSAQLTQGVKPSLFAIGGALLILNLLGASLAGLGLFITVPFSGLTMAAVYRQLSASRQDARAGPFSLEPNTAPASGSGNHQAA
jgi:hypothetical protein